MLPPDQLAIIKATVPILRAHGETVTTVFYHNVLRDYPSLNALFNQGNQATGHQARALANAVLAYAQYIESPDTLGPALKHINHKHASLFIQPAQYSVVGTYLLDAFAEVLGSDTFTPEIRTAWASAYTELADTMITAEKALYATTPDWTDWRPFAITAKTPESSEITSFTLTPVDKQPLPTYLPGQFISIQIPVPSLGYTQVRQYSLSSSPSNSQSSYRISVKREPGVSLNDTTHPGLVSNVLHSTASVGDVVHLSHPWGDFTLDHSASLPSPAPNPTSPLVLISAGVGITPLLSMLTSTLSTHPSRPITWIHASRTTPQRAFHPTIQTLSHHHANLTTINFLTNPTDSDIQGTDYDFKGRVDLDKCEEKVKGCLGLGDAGATYFVCGPDGFMDGIKRELVRRGVEVGRVRVEKFGTGGI